MTKLNKDRKGCVDVFHTSLVQGCKYAGEYDIPVIKPEYYIPRKCIRFSKAKHEKEDFNQWVVFYEDDFLFERIWNNTSNYLSILKKFEGVITPDFSLYYDMPLAMQIWNIYRSRAIGFWLQKNGIRVIPNIRFGVPETYQIACDGVSKHSVIAIGTLGCIKRINYRERFEEGILAVSDILQPDTIIFYGALPGNINELKGKGINIVNIKPDFSYSRKGVR